MRQKQPIPSPADPIRDKRHIGLIKTMLKDSHKLQEFLLFVVGINSGLRVSDLIELTPEHFWTEELAPRRKVRIKTRKTGAMTEFQINKAIKEALELYLKTQELPEFHKPLFNISSRTVTRWVKSWCHGVGLDDGNYSAHSLRKTYAYQLWAANGKTYEALIVVQKTLGHKTSGVTLDYLGMSRKQVEALQAALNL